MPAHHNYGMAQHFSGPLERRQAADLMNETLAAADTINGFAGHVITLVKQLTNQAFEVPLS